MDVRVTMALVALLVVVTICIILVVTPTPTGDSLGVDVPQTLMPLRSLELLKIPIVKSP